jgi:FKBP-type peptidyl-prolyl cis-trans isomerase FklB
MIQKKFKAGILAIAVITAVSFVGCNSGSYSGKNAKLHNNTDSVSYALGYSVGKNLKQNGMSDINPQVFSSAMNVASSGDSSKIPPQKMQAMMRRFQMQAQQKQMKKQQKEGEKNKKKGEAFLKKNKKKKGVQTTKSGLQYKVVKKGSGASPTKKDTVVVNYTGKHLNGKTFDQNDSASIPVGHVIPGWQEGMQLMKKGATYKFWIPGKLAYGKRTQPGGKIKPNETLKFKVHLIQVK